MATKKQSRSKVKGLVNPKGVTQVFGTPIDFKALPEKITIGRRVANGKFKLEAHYPAKHFNDKQEYIDKRKAGSYCRFYDKKSPFFIARTVWDATSQPGMHMITKNRGETHRFIVTPKVDDPTKASIIGSYLVHRDNGDPVLCSGVIGELEAVGDDGDFKVTPYQNHGIRCPKFDDQKQELAGHIPKTFEYKKSTKPRGPRKTAADYCKPSHTFKHPTDIKKAEMISDMDDEMDDAVSCLKCSWDGTYEDLVFVDADGTGGGGYDFHLACPLCEEDEWLDDMMAEGVDEPCFSCDGMGNHWDGKQWSESDCSYCEGSGLMSDTLRAEMAMFNNEYFDADCGCFKKAEGKVWGEKLISGWSGSNLGKNKKAEASLVAAKHGYSGPTATKDEQTCIFCGSMKDLHGFGTPINDGSGHASALFQNICGECVEGYAAEHKTLSFMDWAKQEEASHLKKYGAEGSSRAAARRERRQKLKESSPTLTVTKVEPSDKITTMNRITFENGLVAGRSKSKDAKVGDRFVVATFDGRFPTIMDADTFEAPYTGAGALMGIKGDSALSSFTTSELTESSAIHGDFDQASLNYSGHQNLEVRAEDKDLDCDLCGGTEEVGYVKDDLSLKVCEYCDIDGPDYDPKLWEAEYTRPTPAWAKPLGLIGGLAAGYISAQMIDNAKE